MTLESAKRVLCLLSQSITSSEFEIDRHKLLMKIHQELIEVRKNEIKMVRELINQYETAQNALD